MENTNYENKWTAKTYLRVVLHCFIQYVLLLATFFMVLVINHGSWHDAFSYVTDGTTTSYILLSILSLFLLSALTFVYYFYEKRDFIFKTSNIVMLCSIFLVSIFICALVSMWDVYARPFALCAMLSLLLIDRRSAIFNNIIFSVFMVLIDALTGAHTLVVTREVVISFILNVITGTLAVFIVDNQGSRFKVLVMGFILSIPVIISALCFEALEGESLLRVVLAGLTSGVFANVLLLVLLPFFEVFFKALTNFRLAELSDHKARLLKELSVKAPGTFNHTVIVSMLAEACSSAIGENHLLARACAYYHDIGKIKNPSYFTENQAGANPHDDLSPELSTEIIRAHAKDGASFIRKRRLPEVLADTAEQHHGTMLIRVFYVKAQKFTDGVLSTENFCYLGPKPKTKINAIIMICDACEAKVRSIKERSYENVDKAVKEIIEERMDMEQFTECDITLKELNIVKNTITNTLVGVYHDRVKYPKLSIGAKRG